MKTWKYVALVVGAAACASAMAQSRTFKAQAGDLRSLLRQGTAATNASTRQLSDAERAELRKQLAQPVRREGKRS